MSKKIKTLLTIAGSDPIGGAGIQADMRVGFSLGLHVVTAITAVTAQNSKGLYEIGAVSPLFLKQQLDAILEDVMPDAVKIGMMGSIENVLVIRDLLKSLPICIPKILDPVLKTTADGKNLLNEDLDLYINILLKKIIPLTDLITPNVFELNRLIFPNAYHDTQLQEIRSFLQVQNMIVTDGDSEEICDILVTTKNIERFCHKKIDCKNLHGTGCIYSSLIASYLALGFSVNQVFKLANKQMNWIIQKSMDYTFGSSVYGPLNINSYKL